MSNHDDPHFKDSGEYECICCCDECVSMGVDSSYCICSYCCADPNQEAVED